MRYDVLIMVSVESVSQYAERRRGNWFTTWLVCKAKVIHVLEGRFQGDTVEFVFQERWPTLESGIVLEVEPRVYRAGAVLALWLRTGRSRYDVVCVQQRIARPDSEWAKLDEATNRAVTQGFERRLRSRPSTLYLEGATDAGYVVSGERVRLLVDMKSLEVTEFRRELPHAK